MHPTANVPCSRLVRPPLPTRIQTQPKTNGTNQIRKLRPFFLHTDGNTGSKRETEQAFPRSPLRVPQSSSLRARQSRARHQPSWKAELISTESGSHSSAPMQCDRMEGLFSQRCVIKSPQSNRSYLSAVTITRYTFRLETHSPCPHPDRLFHDS